MKSHSDIKLEKYCQVLNIEVNTMKEMVYRDLIPSAFKYMNMLADTEFKMQRVFNLCDAGLNMMKKLNDLVNDLSKNTELLEKIHEEINAIPSLMEKAHGYAKKILPQMEKVRSTGDQIEPLLGQEFKPYPSYEDLLYSVQ